MVLERSANFPSNIYSNYMKKECQEVHEKNWHPWPVRSIGSPEYARVSPTGHDLARMHVPK